VLKSEESEEECEFTDGADDEEFEFNENTFQKRFAGADNFSASKGPSVEIVLRRNW